jgi:hypothetical protein
LRKLLLAIAISLLALAGLGPTLSPGAPATLQYSTGEFVVNCTSSGQLCEPPFEQTVQVPSGGRVTSVMYTPPPGHCSPVRIHVLLDGTEIGVTGFVEPNESSELGLFSDPIRKGSVVLGYKAEGKTEGCNSGQLSSWGGSIITTVTLPQTKIRKGPPKKTHRRSARFTFSANEAGSKFECKLDRKKFKRCKSPRKYKGLKPGRHTFKVRSIDSAGNRDSTPARQSWKILG